MKLAQVSQLPDCLIQALEIDTLRDPTCLKGRSQCTRRMRMAHVYSQAQIEDAQVRAFAETGPAIDGKASLWRDERTKRRFSPSQ
jgi:hypothetical protein